MKSVIGMLLLTLLASPASFADGNALPLWTISGDTNTVYLLGSIHLLREQDYPLAAEIDAAYEDAESIYMELDMDDLDPAESQALSLQMGMIADQRSLADLLGAKTYSQATELADAIDIPLAMLGKTEPWFAAMNIEMMLLTRIGFNPELGIESHFLKQSESDEKPIVGLESLEQQLGYLDGLSAHAQRELLMQTLSDGASIKEVMEPMVDAWRRGDVNYLEENLLAEMQQFPELNDVIVVKRNLAWAETIKTLLDDEDDYLIIVGTLHLIGDGGVPELLIDRGYDVTQVYRESLN